MTPSVAGISRRTLLKAAGLAGLGMTVGGWLDRAEARPTHRRPESRPYPRLPEGTDTLPQIEHIIILMMENHSFDNYFATLPPHIDGARHGAPPATNPDGNGHIVQAFRMPSTCQLAAQPSQAWNASHLALGVGRNDGFILGSGPVAMGYWTGDDIPFYHGLAQTFPLATRWFCSTLCQTYPNRRFLMAGTAAGIINTTEASIRAPAPPNGNIFERLDRFDISWANYTSDAPSLAILLEYAKRHRSGILPIDQLFVDAAAGTLPSVSLVDPPFVGQGSEENPGDVRIGEQFASDVIRAVMAGPGWPKTLLVWLYDEHGGYYDRVRPPRVIPPDDILPNLEPSNLPGGYDRYGFRVPAVVVSPFARPNYRSRTVRDHTAILKFIETKWNLGALTYRDANADNLFDCLDFNRPPAFLEPPELPLSALDRGGSPDCEPGDPGEIPPPGSVTPGPDMPHLARLARSLPPEPDIPMGVPLAKVWGTTTA